MIDFARLKAVLSTSKMQSENNALYQTIFQIIDQLKEVFDINTAAEAALNVLIANVRKITIIEADTSSVPVTYDLSQYLVDNGLYIFKDTGNASVNTITLTGTVEGAVDPTITTDYGLLAVYRSTLDGLYYYWQMP